MINNIVSIDQNLITIINVIRARIIIINLFS